MSSTSSPSINKTRPAQVSRSASEPVSSPQKQQQSSSTSSSQHQLQSQQPLTLQSKSTDITSTILNDEEDDVLAQATAIALQAQQELAKQAQQLNHKKNQNPFLAVIESHANNAGVSFNFDHQEKTKSLPLGDMEQRKLIEQKLANMNTGSHGHGGGNSNGITMGVGMKDVKEKLEHFFQPNINTSANTPPPPPQANTSSSGTTSPNTITIHGMNTTTTTTTTTNASAGTSPMRPSQQPPQNNVTAATSKTVNSTTVNASNFTTIEKPLLSAIVWKRRSGYGKYSMNAWEKRKIQLIGSKVMYYKCKENGNPQGQPPPQQQQQQQQEQTTSLDGNLSPNHDISATPSIDTNHSELSSLPTRSMNDGMSISASNTADTSLDVPTLTLSTSNVNNNSNNTSANTPSKPPKKDLQQFWEQTKQNITKSINELSISNNNNNANLDDDPDSPRGIIDLHKENVSVAAISDHEKSLTSVSPTPYGLCIMNMSRKSGVGVGVVGVGGGEQNKWKICFESHAEQIKWLTILTEIIVRKSVNIYNQELLQSKNRGSNSGMSPLLNDSSSGGGGNKIITPGTGSGLLDAFRPSPKRKDGMWNFDEQFSGRNLLEKRMDVTQKDDEDDDISYDDEDENKDDFDIVSAFPSTTESTSTKKKRKKDIVESPIIYDLPEAIVAFILKGSRSSHGWFIRGHNLNFVVAVVNIALVWVYISPVHWILFPFYLILVNAALLVVVMETEGNDHSETEMFNSIRSSVQILRRSLNKEKDKKNPSKSNKPSKKSEAKSISPKKRQHDNAIINCSKKPIAGTTTIRLSDPSDSHFVNNHEFIAWTTHTPQDVQVRSHGYLKTKKKIPSPTSLYEVTNVEVFDSDFRVSEMASKVVLPQVHHDDNNGGNIRWKSPDSFVVSLAIPTEEPSLTRSTEDGFGLNVTIYYKMKTETREILKRITEPGYNPTADSTEKHLDEQKRITNGVRLWEEWCQRAPTDADWQARFKLIPNVLNPTEVGLPSWIAKYCGKPVLIKRRGKTGFLSTHSEFNAFEFDISLHVFPYLAKKAMAYLRSTIFKKALASLAYVVEARSDDELPEVLIGEPVKLYYPDPDIIIHANHFFAGTAPKSLKLD